MLGVLLATKASVHDIRARIFVRYVMAFMINILNVFRTVLLFASDAWNWLLFDFNEWRIGDRRRG